VRKLPSPAGPPSRSRATRKQRRAEEAALGPALRPGVPHGDGALPSKEAIIAYLAAHPEAGKRDLVKQFGIKGGVRIALKRLMREIEVEVLVERGRVETPGELPAMLVAEVSGRDADGELIASPIEWDEAERGTRPRIVVERSARPRPGEPSPGVGDRVLLRLTGAEVEGEPATGRVVRLLAARPRTTLGVYRALPEGGGRVVPTDKKAQGREIAVPPGEERGAKDGDLVTVSLTRDGRLGLSRGRVEERLGSLKSERAVSLVAIHVHDIPHEFSRETLREAGEVRAASLGGREDWRDLPLVTIDPADAKDHDDAVHARPDDDPANPGGHIVTVAIADVAAYVRPGSALDGEALKRGNSVYFPDRVVPMLPERISNDLCSLRQGEDRPALAVRLVLDAAGLKRRHSFHRVLMRSHAKLAYDQAQAAIDGRPDDVSAPVLEGVLRPLWAAYETARAARDDRAPLDLDLPERKLVLNPDGTVARVIVPPRLDAHRLIEEFMIAANVAAAETLERAKSPLIYRAHDEPSVEKMRALGEVLASVGIKLPKAGAVRPALFNHILARAKGTQHAAFINEIVLRSQAQAEYTAENYGHFGLNLRRYAHFTSPIRRYADLVVHRALISAQGWGGDGLTESDTRASLTDVAQRISAAERRAMVAERETIDRLIAHFMADRIGAEFPGRISGATRAGLFVRLAETGADGFIPASTLGDEFFAYDEAAHALVGSRTGRTHRLGDEVEVRLVEAQPVAGALRFELLSEGQAGRPLPRSRRGVTQKSHGRPEKGGRRARRILT